jgi:hypothetical protein
MEGDPNIIVEFLLANFPVAKIQKWQNPDEAEFRPIGEVCSILTRSFDEWKDDPDNYVDVISTRR